MDTSTLIKGFGPISGVGLASPSKVTSRMSLANVRKGIISMPLRVLLYATEKVGKSTFASASPDPIFLGQDSGTEQLDVARFQQPETWRHLLDAIEFLLNEEHSYKTLVIDPINWFEALASAHVIGNSGKSIEDWGGGYGRGHTAMMDLWRALLKSLETLRDTKRMNVIFLAHSQVKLFNDPEGPPYDRYSVAMNEKVAQLLRGWVDAVLFAKVDSFGRVDDKTKRARGITTGSRILYTAGGGAFDAGVRWKWMPTELPLSWPAFAEEVQKSVTIELRCTEMLEQIEKLLSGIEGEEGYVRAVRDYVAKNLLNPDNLIVALNRLTLKVSRGLEANQEEKKGDSK